MGVIKQALTSAAGDAALRMLVAVLESAGAGSSRILRVLTYHRIDHHDPRSPLNPRLISASPEEFERQMDLIADRQSAVSLQQVLDAVEGRISLPRGAVLITFDDAYRCFARTAHPILTARNLPSTLFVPTAFPDSPNRFWWDRLYAAIFLGARKLWIDRDGRRWPLGTNEQRQQVLRHVSRIAKSLPSAEAMDMIDRVCDQLDQPQFENPLIGWHDLRRLSQQGVAIAAHTRTHPLMNNITLDEARSEAVDSYLDLCAQIGDVPRALAYPAGSHTNQLARVLQLSGFRAAFTTRRGLNVVGRCDPLRFNRINIGIGTSVALLRAQLLPQNRYRFSLNH